MQKPSHILTISCPDRIGIVAEVAGFLRDHGCNITDSAQFGDVSSNRFFMRVSLVSETEARLLELKSAFASVAERFDMKANFYDAARKVRSLILVSKFSHCLVDLIYRQQTHALNIEIPLVASNHQDFEPLAKMHNISFRYLPVSSETRKNQEEALAKIISDEKIDFVILARYICKSCPLIL